MMTGPGKKWPASHSDLTILAYRLVPQLVVVARDSKFVVIMFFLFVLNGE